jgi:hypothetical protein
MLARLRTQGDLKAQNRLADRGMQQSLWLVTILFLAVALLLTGFFRVAETDITFVPPQFWALMGLGAILIRFGASHLLYYSTTNHIIFHKVNLVSGLIIVGSSISLYPFIGWYAFPISQVVSSLMFQSWYPARITFLSFRWDFPGHILRTMGLPVSILLLYLIAVALF